MSIPGVTHNFVPVDCMIMRKVSYIISSFRHMYLYQRSICAVASERCEKMIDVAKVSSVALNLN